MGQGGRISCLLDENMENNRVFTYPLMQLQLFVNSSHSQTIQWSHVQRLLNNLWVHVLANNDLNYWAQPGISHTWRETGPRS